MNHNNTPIIKLNPINIHSVSSIRIPAHIKDFNALQPSVRLKPINLHSASSFHIPSVSVNKCFFNGPKIILSPLRSSIHYNISNSIQNHHRRYRVYPKTNKCNSRRCKCCNFISCKSTVKSTVNGRTFSTRFTHNIDCNSSHIIYVLT